MLATHDSIHVLYGSNTVDLWMIAATLLTFSSSLVLGIAALRNGSKATRIAQEASERDEIHREAARLQRRDEKRFAAAAAMTKAIWALDAALIHVREVPGSEEAKTSGIRANTLKMEAMVEIELMHPDEYPTVLLEWFEATTKRLPSIKSGPPSWLKTRDLYRGEAIGSIRRWKNRIVTVHDFLDPNRSL